MNYGNYFFAFDPSADNEKIMYERYTAAGNDLQCAE